MRILNNYAGIGGNRKLWGNEHEITAIENDPEIASIYKSYFPNDRLIITDAHQYLLNHYKEFDFIWNSPPCPTHSRARMWASKGDRYEVMYPDMALYQEIILLNYFFEGKHITENVTPYYESLIKPSVILDRHCIWSNFEIISFSKMKNNETKIHDTISATSRFGFDISNLKLEHRKDQIIRNLVDPEIGLHILNSAIKSISGINPNQEFVDNLFKL